MNPMQVITWMAQIAKKYSTISIPGVYGSAYDQFPLGLLFNRNVSIHMGQCPVKKYTEQLFHLIETKRIDPTKVISHIMDLKDAPAAYENFDKKEDVLKIMNKTIVLTEYFGSIDIANLTKIRLKYCQS